MSRSAPSSRRREPTIRLRREPLAVPCAGRIQLDAAQRSVVEHRGGPLLVLGAPGTGKTTALVAAVVDRVRRDGLDPGQLLVLAPTRAAAARLRERVTGEVAATVREPLGRTPQSFAFGVLRQLAALTGGPVPRLITGPEQDAVLRELLAGHELGLGAAPQWPEDLRAALATRGFRGELRDLLMRAIERGVDPRELAALGRRHGRPQWVAAAHVMREYLDVTALGAPAAFDPAAIVSEAVGALSRDQRLLAHVRSQVQMVAMDDAHEATSVVADLLHAVVGPRPGVLLTADPDSVTQAFRGADPALLGTGQAVAAIGDATTVVLQTSWRQGEMLRAVSRRVADRIGAVGGARQRSATSPEAVVAGDVGVYVLRTSALEVRHIADALRREHLSRSVPWADMAVLVRGHAQATQLRRGLESAGVPVDVPLTDLPVRDQPAVVPLLDAFEVALAISQHEAGAGADVERELVLDPGVAESLLLSPLGGTDSVGVRRLRRALRGQELGGGGGRSSDALLCAALVDPVRLAPIDRFTAEPARRVGAVLAAAVAAVAAVPAGSAESVLWALWSTSGLASAWRRAALAGGARGARADRDLDAVVALFDAAARFVDRLPQAGPREFVEYLRGQDVAADTLAERGWGAGVAVLTAASAAGRQWRTVAVAGVQEGVWPDLRVRGSLLGSEHLVDVLVGRSVPASTAGRGAHRAAVARVRDDEARLFHVAVSRASERLLVTAVRDDEQQPSPYLDLVDPPPSTFPAPGWDGDGARVLTRPGRPLTLAGAVSRLRQVVTADSEPEKSAAAATLLARLASAHVPGAHPDDWYGASALTDARPLETEHPVRVSPSKVEEFDRCALRWLLQQAGGSKPSSSAQHLGNLVHEIAAEHPDATVGELVAELHQRWAVLGLGEGWVGDRGRRRAETMMGKLAGYFASARERDLVGTEIGVDVVLDLPSGPARLTGRVDRLERDESGLHVVDLKTGTSQPKSADIAAQPQLGTYQLAAQAGAFDALAAGEPSASASLVQLGTSTKSAVRQVQGALPDDGGWAGELLSAVAAGMSADRFAATINEVCDRCPVRTSCPARGEGRQVTQ